mmetsp:Transcript_64443/g.153779  ORF Transcript_64443/g.153779 Transcript_64443/m.153779 type:complete len:250 (+) Transcript_64443:690-1439(+)
MLPQLLKIVRCPTGWIGAAVTKRAVVVSRTASEASSIALTQVDRLAWASWPKDKPATKAIVPPRTAHSLRGQNGHLAQLAAAAEGCRPSALAASYNLHPKVARVVLASWSKPGLATTMWMQSIAKLANGVLGQSAPRPAMVDKRPGRERSSRKLPMVALLVMQHWRKLQGAMRKIASWIRGPTATFPAGQSGEIARWGKARLLACVASSLASAMLSLRPMAWVEAASTCRCRRHVAVSQMASMRMAVRR